MTHPDRTLDQESREAGFRLAHVVADGYRKGPAGDH